MELIIILAAVWAIWYFAIREKRSELPDGSDGTGSYTMSSQTQTQRPAQSSLPIQPSRSAQHASRPSSSQGTKIIRSGRYNLPSSN